MSDPVQPLFKLTTETKSLLDGIMTRIRAARRVQVIGHIRPDGDCIGSLLGFHHVLEHCGVPHALAAEELMYPGYVIMPGYSLIEASPRSGFDADTTVFLDCGDRKRAFPDWKASGWVINIDHHASNTRFGDLNWVDPKCAAACEMLFHLAAHARIPLNPEFADALLLGILTDTGSLRYSNVRPDHYEMCGQLLRAGADVTLIAKAAYESRSPESVRLGAGIMASLNYLCGGRLVWGEARKTLLDGAGGTKNMPENLVGEMRGIEGVRVSLLFIETPKEGLRVSLRGDGLVNLSLLAQEFGGGGHPNASGATVEKGNYESLRDQIINRVGAAVTEKQTTNPH